MSPEQELVTVMTINYHGETLRYEAMLNGSGIFYTWKDAETVTVDPLLSQAVGGIKLQVRPDDVEEVKAILKKFESDDESITQKAEIVHNGAQYIHIDEYCPNCDNFGVYMEHGSFLKRLSKFGQKRKRTCTDCKHEW